MLAGVVMITAAVLALFGLLVWVLYRETRQQLRRAAVPGASVRASAKGFGALVLALAGVWACLYAGMLLSVKTGAPPMVVSIGLVMLFAFARPLVVAAGIHPYVIRPEGGDPGAPVTGGRPDDAAVYAEHRAALARGEKRTLRTTVTGQIHSYAQDEHVAPSDDPYNLRSLPVGIGIAALYVGLALMCALIFANQVVRGESLNWVLAVGVVLVLVVGRPAFVFCRDEFRAGQVRKSRGVPKPDRGREVPLPEAGGPGAGHIDLQKRPDSA